MAEEAHFRLKFLRTASSELPLAVNCAAAHITQGTAYIDFGFLEPELLIAFTDKFKAGEKLPDEVEARHVVRVAMSPEGVRYLAMQLNDVLTKAGILKAGEPK